MIIQHNRNATFTTNYVQQNVNAYGKSVNRLSTGYRINSAADDAAGLTISEKLRWQVRGLHQDSRNIQDGISLIQVADGALQEVHDMLKRMDELAVQAANDTNAEADRNALQMEIDEIANEIDRIGLDTEFNTIKVFKPSRSPTMIGTPVDIKAYHLDDGRIGGIIYNGKRYAYDQHGFAFDNNGNVKEGTYTITAKGPTGDDVDLKLVYDGTSRAPVSRLYDLKHEANLGLSIDGVTHLWTEMEDSQGNKLDPGNVKGGKYTFYHSGLAISIELEDGENLEEVGGELVPSDGLFTYTLQSMGVSTSNPKVTLITASPAINITNANQNDIPIYTDTNRGFYSMNADDDGMWLSYQDKNNQTVNLTKMTWQQLRLTNFSEQGGVNPGHTVNDIKNENIPEEKYNGYTYTDNRTGISLHFVIDSEVSKAELIQSVDNWTVNLTTNNSVTMQATSGGGATISVNGYSNELGTFGRQFEMGRDMGTQMTLADGTNTGVVTYNGTNDQMSFGLSDANGTNYSFTASGVKNGIDGRVQSSANSASAAYIRTYENWLNSHGGSSAGFNQSMNLSVNNTVNFTSAEGYYVGLRYGDSERWNFNSNNFNVSRDPVTGRYTASLSSAGQTAFNQFVSNFADGIVNSLANTKLTAQTNANVRGTVDVINPVTTTNQVFSSQVIYTDRELKIQAGPLNGQYIGIKLPAMNASALGVRGLHVDSYASAGSAISLINKAIDRVSEIRSAYGATMNRLEAAMRVDDLTAENTQAAESRLRDADMADESVENARHNILIQCGQSMLAQANQSQNGVMQLLL